MKMLSLGIPSTLGNWLNLCNAMFGEKSKPAEFIKQKIADSANGADEEVIADEQQLLMVLGHMFEVETYEKNGGER